MASQRFEGIWPVTLYCEEGRKRDRRDCLYCVRGMEWIDALDVERSYTSRELIDIVRVRTFPPYRRAYIEHSGAEFIFGCNCWTMTN
jgi:hypothetical protein